MRHLYRILTIILCVTLCASASAQIRTVTFTGRDRTNQYLIPLHHVNVFNLDQLWEEVLVYPDTTLTMGTVGIGEHELPSGLRLMQNVPNPFDGNTEFVLILPTDNDVTLEIYDISGKLTVSRKFGALPAGSHLFRATLMAPQTYLLGATTRDGQTTIKMVNEGHGGENAIQHIGMTNANGDFTLYLKNEPSGTAYPFNVGDEMKYIGYTMVDGVQVASNAVVKQQTEDETISFVFDFTLPSVNVQAITNLTGTTASCFYTVISDGGSMVSAHGICWSTSPNPTIENSLSHTNEGSGIGNFTSNITGLSMGTTYYVRAYATNIVGTVYGEQESFTTLSLPIVTTDTVSDITGTTATCGGNVTDDGGASVTSRGVCWSTSPNPSLNSNLGFTYNNGGTGSFTSSITGLSAGTTYYVKAYATNSVGTNYGEQRSFTTLSLPTVTTDTVTDITGTTATCGGNVTNDGGATVTARGVCWSTSPNPTTESSLNHTNDAYGMGYFTSNITGLSLGTTYYVRAYATTIAGTNYGEQRSFTTLSLPTVTTDTVTDITGTTATCGGNVTNDGGATVTARGVCWSTSQNPTISNSHTTDGDGTGSFTSALTGLTTGTTYYVRAYATSIAGTAYGERRIFKPTYDGQPCPNATTMTDYEGHSYPTVQIGSQCWMAKNLRTTHYSNGTSIPAGGSSTSSTNPYYYNNTSTNISLSDRGYLYNWPAVMHGASSSNSNPSGVQGICPTGWHVPSDAEWTQLTNYVSSISEYQCGGSSSYIAKALASETGWNSYSGECRPGDQSQHMNNATGFSAVPAGLCYGSSFDDVGGIAYFWSSTQIDSGFAWNRYLGYNLAYVGRFSGIKYYGFSVRCLRD